ncbi:MAG: sialate O-acetylesterase [Planctomycetota bacterium]
MTNVFLLAGQSNMVGGATTSELPEALRTAPPNVRLYEDGAYRELAWRETFGPEVGFAHAVARRMGDEPIVLCKVAVGGANLQYDWNADGVSHGDEDTYRGPFYPRLIAAMAEVVSSLAGEPFGWGALLWMQGERDSVFESMARLYEANLAGFVAAVRRDTGRADLPALIAQVAPRRYELDEGRFFHAYRRLVWDAQRRYADRDPHAVYIETLDLPQHDNLHFDTAGQFLLGRRFAQAYLGEDA